jgi:hypothetical protein
LDPAPVRSPQGTLEELDGLGAISAQAAMNLPIVSNQCDPRIEGVG